MTTLIYRGKTYTQTQKASIDDFVKLTYRRSIYTNRKKDVSSKKTFSLKYRGLEYQS